MYVCRALLLHYINSKYAKHHLFKAYSFAYDNSNYIAVYKYQFFKNYKSHTDQLIDSFLKVQSIP